MATVTVSWSGGGDGTIIDIDNSDSRVGGGEGTHWFTGVADGPHRVNGQYGNSTTYQDIEVVGGGDVSVSLRF